MATMHACAHLCVIVCACFCTLACAQVYVYSQLDEYQQVCTNALLCISGSLQYHDQYVPDTYTTFFPLRSVFTALRFPSSATSGRTTIPKDLMA